MKGSPRRHQAADLSSPVQKRLNLYALAAAINRRLDLSALAETVSQQVNIYAIATSAAELVLLALPNPAQGKIVFTPVNVKIDSFGYDINFVHAENQALITYNSDRRIKEPVNKTLPRIVVVTCLL